RRVLFRSQGPVASGLQWGHLSLEVVMDASHAVLSELGDASMGPPLFRGGHNDFIHVAPTLSTKLQWGHLSLEVVIGTRGVAGQDPPCASMGPPLFRGGHAVLAARFKCFAKLQWGHLSLEVVILGDGRKALGRAASFNGATSL